MLAVCTDITGRPDLYQQNGGQVQEEIARILGNVPKETPPSVLLLITYSGGAAVQNADTMTGRMIKELGCVNIADENPSLLREYSLESVILSNPDFVFVIPMGNDDEAARQNLLASLESNPAWQSLAAVREGRYHLLPKSMFLYKPNLRWSASYQYLADILYAE
jgi:iron complex transport system substrate-binding protein